jgi:hypothetical protein
MSSGEEQVTAESGWYYSPAEAESECNMLLEDLIDVVVKELESDGKEVIGGENASIEIAEDQGDGGKIYKAQGTHIIRWKLITL